MSSRFLEISVSNSPSDGKMSFRGGIANLIFQVPQMNSTLNPQSIRLTGKIQFFKDATPTTPSAPMAVNERLGVYNCFESLTTRSIKHQQTIESIRHYAHMLSNYLPLTTSLSDAMGTFSQSALTMPNQQGFNKSVVYTDASSEFSLPLPCGLFNGTSDIPLSENQLGGLELVLALASDSQVIYSLTGTTTELSDAFYEFTDLKLVCEVMDYNANNPPPSTSQGVFTYQSISSYYDTINSQNANIVFNLGLSKVRSVFSSFVPSNFLNNRAFNSYSTLPITNKDGTLANITKLVWTKGGSLYPKHFEMNNVIRDSPSTTVIDPVILNDYVSAISPFRTNMKNMISPANTTRETLAKFDATNILSYEKIPDSGYIYGLGIRYDQLGGTGSDFTQEQWGMNIQSGLTTDNPQSVFIFVNSEIVVGFNQNGIQITQ